MTDVTIVPDMLRESSLEIPDTLEQALDPKWLSKVLSHLSDGAPVVSVETTGIVKTMASKVRIAITFENAPEQVYHLCLKGFLGQAGEAGMGGATTLRESDFYVQIAPKITMCTPPCAAVVVDRAAKRAIIVMADLIAAGVHFYDALQPLTPDLAGKTLDQLARLHANPKLLSGRDWIPSRLTLLAAKSVFPWDEIQALMRDGRGGNLPERTLDSSRLKQAIEGLAAWNKDAPQTILHGDTHPGNLYRTRKGQVGFTDWQLIQRGHWSLDVAYHIAAALPVETAEREERYLLEQYLDALGSHGGVVPDFETAWGDYRRAHVYGFYHWAITRGGGSAVINETFTRLGEAVTRHESYKLLGL